MQTVIFLFPINRINHTICAHVNLLTIRFHFSITITCNAYIDIFLDEYDLVIKYKIIKLNFVFKMFNNMLFVRFNLY